MTRNFIIVKWKFCKISIVSKQMVMYWSLIPYIILKCSHRVLSQCLAIRGIILQCDTYLFQKHKSSKNFRHFLVHESMNQYFIFFHSVSHAYGIYPINYAHSPACFCTGLVQFQLTHMMQCYLTGTRVIIGLLQCQWSNPDEFVLFLDRHPPEMSDRSITEQNKLKLWVYFSGLLSIMFH